MTEECDALKVRIEALEKLVNEREDRTKERFLAMDRNISMAMLGAEKAVTKAEIATERRLKGVNEFRETLRDQAATLMPRTEYLAQHQSLIDIINKISTRNSELMPRSGYTLQHNALAEILNVLGRRVGTIEDKDLGKTEGLSLTGQIILGLIATVSAAGAILQGIHLLK